LACSLNLLKAKLRPNSLITLPPSQILTCSHCPIPKRNLIAFLHNNGNHYMSPFYIESDSLVNIILDPRFCQLPFTIYNFWRNMSKIDFGKEVVSSPLYFNPFVTLLVSLGFGFKLYRILSLITITISIVWNLLPHCEHLLCLLTAPFFTVQVCKTSYSSPTPSALLPARRAYTQSLWIHRAHFLICYTAQYPCQRSTHPRYTPL